MAINYKKVILRTKAALSQRCRFNTSLVLFCSQSTKSEFQTSFTINQYENRTRETSQHVFTTSYKKKSKWNVAEELKAQELYNKDGLIALNKPYGMRMSHLPKSTANYSALEYGGQYDNQPTFEDILPFLCDIYKENLYVASAPERWSSGVLLLSTSEQLKEKIRKCYRRSFSTGVPQRSFLVVSLSPPVPTSLEKKTAIRMMSVKDGKPVPVITQEYSNRMVKRKEVEINLVKHKVLQSSTSNVSLVNVEVARVMHNFLRVWMAHSFAPVLGDFLFGGRVKTVMGKKVAFNPLSSAAYQPPAISSEVLETLQIQKKSMDIIPCHIHLHKIFLNRFFGRNKGDLTIMAPAPDYFKWTCNQFQLQIPQQEAIG